MGPDETKTLIDIKMKVKNTTQTNVKQPIKQEQS